MNLNPLIRESFRSQHGGGLLAMILVLAVSLVLIQTTLFRKTQDGISFSGKEMKSIKAQSAAHSSVEHIIADLGTRSLWLQPGMNKIWHNNLSLGESKYTSHIETGISPETLMVRSSGKYREEASFVEAKLEVINKIMTIDSLPPLDTSPSFLALLSASPAPKKIDVCHIPPGNPLNAHTINLPFKPGKPPLSNHQSHHGDYLGPCDGRELNYPDTTVKVRIISWKE